MENKNFRINKNPRLKKLSVKRTNFLNYKQQLKHSTRHEYDATIKFAKKKKFSYWNRQKLESKTFSTTFISMENSSTRSEHCNQKLLFCSDCFDFYCNNVNIPFTNSKCIFFSTIWPLIKSSKDRCNFAFVWRFKHRPCNNGWGERSFSCCAPRIWNALPLSLRSLPTLSSFRAQLKTFMFRIVFPWILYHPPIVSLRAPLTM